MHWESSSGFRSLVMELVLEERKEWELGHQWGAYDSRPAGGSWLQVVKVQRSGPQSTSTLECHPAPRGGPSQPSLGLAQPAATSPPQGHL